MRLLDDFSARLYAGSLEAAQGEQAYEPRETAATAPVGVCPWLELLDAA